MTDDDILEIRDAHLPSQGEAFDMLAFGRAVAAEARAQMGLELEAQRLYARALCKAVDAATDFAGTVAGGAIWWDDVWADHAAALDRARERISVASETPTARANLTRHSAMTDQATQEAPTLPDHRPAVAGQVSSGVRPHVVPVTLHEACDFIARHHRHHRHNKPPRGWKFGVGLKLGAELVGVATAGRPVARHYDDDVTLEVNRTCTDGTPNANSMLYGAVWRAAKAMGYKRCITYTQADETGASLRAAGWVKLKELKPRASWGAATKDERLRAMRDPVGNGGVARVLWECRIHGA